MNKILPLYGLLALFAFSSCSRQKTARQPDTVITDTTTQMVMQIQRTSRLYTTECKVHKIITHDDRKKLSGSFMSKEFSIDLPVGKRKVAIPIDATIKAYINFEDFSAKNVHKNGNKINIILPDPKLALTNTKINHQEIRQYVAITRSDFSDAELADYERQGRQAIIDDIPNLGIIDQARESAARTLIPIIRQLGYADEDITVTFRKKFTLSDLPTLLDRSTIEKANTSAHEPAKQQ